MNDFCGKSVVVTGASMGMGRACVERFVRGGAQVLAIASDAASLRQLQEDIPASVRGFLADVRHTAAMEEAMAQAARAWGGIDVLVCSAGIQRYGTVVDTPEATWDEVIDVNLKGVFLAAKHAIPWMKPRAGGAIVAISSVQAFASQTQVAAYTASKGGINALVRAMALDHAPDNITVNTVCPASVDTPMLRWAADIHKGTASSEATLAAWGKGHPLGRVGHAWEIAEAVAFLAGSNARFITGTELKIDGGVLSKLGIALPE
ncbi:SDR family NAD(P)-dependent oxidoreductase [Verminephrobacter aporrectodeae]|uniref:SDR family oxidoreductase n=1 Tax=Verminephrobacter aporrectodeae subsp. tuberculatae TaxID=1110392 RepID=A0ABT3KPB8_9BURK|nr:SDR family oxidoreductase [Verminephrobacter aporrectodeae]MCW5220896.1 SDR family oxidoreductase [Verminephrobacter aporrectodeae subsp. tuberculatae]MCW5255149.1 SDR family oxidoreductase [Verminephrobacter aporrectodeae subsp. tuberculatae]MCW5290191.1 SDR family oxidoreductase [Verminephrobacter aporrectodeae subsp. tuberculatae]MCW5320160.1 SDR family oxidoreductase [Verminephrobacter aporrectodeae subsp. tuberculatae]MCW8165424.1 SDR family oxidoreductase [Verminephrobacter aporrectod